MSGVHARGDDQSGEPPPGWVLGTPTRLREVLTLPVAALVLAAVIAFLGTRVSGTLGLVVGTVCAVVVGAGAVALTVAGRAAYEEQTLEASWRLHVVRMVVGVGTASIVALGALAVGTPFGFGVLYGGAGAFVVLFRSARSVPRSDRVLVARASVVVAVSCLALSVLGLTLPDLPERLAAAWIGPGALFCALAVVMAVVQFAAAERASDRHPLDDPALRPLGGAATGQDGETGERPVSAPDRSGS